MYVTLPLSFVCVSNNIFCGKSQLILAPNVKYAVVKVHSISKIFLFTLSQIGYSVFLTFFIQSPLPL